MEVIEMKCESILAIVIIPLYNKERRGKA